MIQGDAASRTGPRTLAAALRDRDDDSLGALLIARPDLARPIPVDMTQLASRVGDPASVRRVVDSLDCLHLAVLSAMTGRDHPVTIEVVQDDVAAEPGAVARAVTALGQLALVWGPSSSLRVTRAVHQVLGPLDSGESVGHPMQVPALAGPRAELAAVDAAAAGAAFEVVRQVETVLDAWALEPPAVLRSGGVGVRDVRAVGARLDVSEEQAGFLVELTAVTGLVARAGDVRDDVWLPSAAAHGWPDRSVADRWAELAGRWLSSARAMFLVAERDERGRPTNALAPGLENPSAGAVRALTMRALASARPQRLAEDAVVAWVAWHRPRRTPLRDPLVRRTLTEARWLGVTGLGVMATAGADLLLGRDPAPALEPLLPRPVATVLLQADLTAVAPGPLQRDLALALALLADVESRGGATVYRFSASSLRRAFDAGWPADQVHAFLAAHSSTPVPQPLTYLVDDVARRHGRLRVGSTRVYLRSDDVAEIDALVADRALAGLQLQRVAPTVLVARATSDVVLERLRDRGHSPVAEVPDGSPHRTSPPRRPVRASGGLPQPPRLSLTAEEARSVVAAVRAGDEAAALRPGPRTGRATALDTLAVLREAAQNATSVWLSYVDRAGTLSERVVDPLTVDAGWLTGHDHRSDRTRSFALHRIRSVAPLMPFEPPDT